MPNQSSPDLLLVLLVKFKVFKLFTETRPTRVLPGVGEFSPLFAGRGRIKIRWKRDMLPRNFTLRNH
jgi:hypothetical protein